MRGAMTARWQCLYTRQTGQDSATTQSGQHLYTMQQEPIFDHDIHAEPEL
jgi:hypothetical protein